ncbi:MAG: hypothetical protein JRI79_12630 [Deltaproteobacteria bacterium]|nr:hypothetical protein [Deltaproteobacteria bacterium]MBW1935819.1 hypothetical protein [Deltaproteobacteria bacterium]MBW1978795.1 hypothetical protein [Deltaproteobacteria bacterium]MBW2045487.1 hypothetical protein [Deltaproteobacteria bacterium]MBW2300422.1 hypothetical protein [Deltaproteobacteria bacterium]
MVSASKRFFFLTIGLFFSSCLVSACGYSLKASGEPVGIELQSLAIPLAKSTSSHLGFESTFTRIIREEFISHARVPLVSESRAQAVLLASIHDIHTDVLGYESRQQNVGGRTVTYAVTNRCQLRVRLSVKLVDRRKGKVIWQEDAMEDKASFAVSEDPLATRYYRDQALMVVARRLAKRIYMKTMERF